MEKHSELKQIKPELLKAIKYKDDVHIEVKIYDCTESGEQTYDVEIVVWYDGLYKEYLDTWVTDIAYEGELALAEKRAKAVLKTVKGWFQYSEDVVVGNDVVVYHA